MTVGEAIAMMARYDQQMTLAFLDLSGNCVEVGGFAPVRKPTLRSSERCEETDVLLLRYLSDRMVAAIERRKSRMAIFGSNHE